MLQLEYDFVILEFNMQHFFDVYIFLSMMYIFVLVH